MGIKEEIRKKINNGYAITIKNIDKKTIQKIKQQCKKHFIKNDTIKVKVYINKMEISNIIGIKTFDNQFIYMVTYSIPYLKNCKSIQTISLVINDLSFYEQKPINMNLLSKNNFMDTTQE